MRQTVRTDVGSSTFVGRWLGSGGRSAMLVLIVVSVGVPLIGSLSAQSSMAAGPPTDARSIYLRDCATCHAPDGKGTSSGPTLEGQGAAGVDFMLSSGRMPLSSPRAEVRRRTPTYTRDVIAELDSYVARLVGGGPGIPAVDISGVDVTAGGSIYREQCAACHQAAGEGGALLGLNSPSLLESTPVQVVEAIRTGPGTMPVFGEAAIPESKVDSLAAYVRTLQHVPDPGGDPLGHLGPLPEGAAALLTMGLLVIVLRRVGSRT